MSIQVLWVEEEPFSLSYERKLANGLGWEITSCETVQNALHLIQVTAFDLVILDLILPMDEATLNKGMVETEAGFTLLNELRSKQRVGQTPPNVPVIIISAIGSMEQRLKVVKTLSAERFFIRKPVNEFEFHKLIQEIDQQLRINTKVH